MKDPTGGDPPAAAGCVDFERMVGPLVDGELPAPEAEEVERHLGACSSCSRLAQDFRSLEKLSRRLAEPPPVAADVWERMWERVRGEPAEVRLEVRRGTMDWLVPALSLAALVLLVTLIGFALFRETPQIRQAHEVLEPVPAQEILPAGPEKPRERG